MAERIVVNTDALSAYGPRIQKVINRLYTVNNRIRNLYYSGDVDGIYSFVSSNRFYNGISILKSCIDYINNTVRDIEINEERAASVNPLNFTDVHAAALRMENASDHGNGSTSNISRHDLNDPFSQTKIIINDKINTFEKIDDIFDEMGTLPSLADILRIGLGEVDGDVLDELGFIASIVGAIAGSIGIAAAGYSEDKSKANKSDGKWNGTLFGGKVESSTEIADVNVSGRAEGEFLGASAAVGAKSKSRVKFDEEGNLDWDTLDVEVNAYAKGEGHVVKGEVSGNIGYLNGELEATALTAGGKGEIGISLLDDGEFAPSVYAEVSAEAAALEGSAEASFGSDEYNIHVDAEGTLAGAEASAKGYIGKIKYTDEATGQEKVEFGVKGEVKAEAYLAEGSIAGGITILGIDVDVKLEGKAGGAGAEASGTITGNGVSGEVGLGLGLGAGVSISIDWSDFSLPEWPFW